MDESEKSRLLRKVERARESGKWDAVERSCRKLAEYFAAHGSFNEALSSYKDVLKACEIQNDSYGVANANRMIGEIFNDLGLFQESLEHANKYLEYSKMVKDKVEEQRALATIGRTYFCWAADLKSASDQYEKMSLETVLKQCRKAYVKSLYICENELNHIDNKERAEMKARLLFNLGLVAEVREDYEVSLSYISKAIKICEEEHFFEDHHRCLVSQGGIYLKQENTQLALNVLDKALDITKNIQNSKEKIIMTLQHKADIYLHMGNYVGAKNILLKAYKLKSTNESDRKSVEILLKQTVALCDTEATLIAQPLENFTIRKSLYEKLGDGCCSLGIYKQGILYYLKMLECAEKSGDTGLQLLPCYVSLAQTYKDSKEYDLALEYCKKELQISSSNLNEACKTYLNMSEILELKGASYLEVTETLNKAKELAEATKDVKLQISVLNSILNVQKNKNKEELAEETRKEIQKLKFDFDIESDESVHSEDEDTPDIAKDVNLEDLLSDSDQDQEEYDRPRVRNPRSMFKIKRNEKGETQLHVAVIKGDLSRSKRLIEQGHPVKEQDLNGWTPLHEACNHGHLEIVDLLLTNGADINDPGGKGCNGITPLHDAASCGHFDIIHFLLDKGASATALTNDGETPLDCLQDWRQRVTLSKEDKEQYDKLQKRLKAILNAAGYIDVRKTNPKTKPNLKFKSSESKNKENLNLRRVCDREDNLKKQWMVTSPVKNTLVCVESNQEESASVEYKNAIESVRKRKEVILNNDIVKNNSALLPEEEYVDDWLEDDIGIFEQPHKKRKTLNLIEHFTVRNKTVPTKSNLRTDLKPDDRLDEEPGLPVNDESEVLEEIVLQDVHSIETSTQNVNQVTNPPSFQENASTQNVFTSNTRSAHYCDIAKVRVKVGERMFLIPISLQAEDLKIRWLCEESSRRYYDIEGMEPLLQIKTKDGAILSNDDPLSVIYNEELEGIITGWNTSSLSDRYKEACFKNPKLEYCCYGSSKRYTPDTYISNLLEMFRATQVLNLESLALTPLEFTPIFTALKHEKFINILNLSENILGDEGIVLLCQVLEKMNSVEEINLSCNNITNVGLKQLCDMFKKAPPFINHLCILNVSFNPINDGCLPDLDIIRNTCKLNSLILDGCDFSGNICNVLI